jgi:hypothetical protein
VQQVGVNEVSWGAGVQGCTVLLHTVANESIDFLKIFIDLPVWTRKVLQEVREEFKHLQERKGCEIHLRMILYVSGNRQCSGW